MDTDFFKKYIDMADDGDRMGWHERMVGILLLDQARRNRKYQG